MELRGTRVTVVNWRDPWHSLAGGSERYAWELAHAMREAGAAVDFLTARDAGQAGREQIEGIRVTRRGGQFTFYGWVLLTLLLQRLRRRPPDVVIDVEAGIPSFTPVVLGRRTPVVLVVHHVHQEQFGTYFRRPLADLGRFLEGPAMRRVYRGRTTVVVSPSTDAEMRRQLGWTGATRLVPNGNVAVPLSDAELIADKAATAPERRILVLGRLVVHKRIGLVLEAFARLDPAAGDLRLDVVGAGPIEDEVRRHVTSLGLDDRVTVHGFLPEEEKHTVLTRAWLHVCGSDAEGWGQVVVEAAAYAVPTVARDVPGLRDSICDGDTGWLVSGDHVDEAAIVADLEGGLRHALDVLDDPDEAGRIRRACRAWAARFDWAGMRRQVREIVAAELADAGPAGPRPCADVAHMVADNE